MSILTKTLEIHNFIVIKPEGTMKLKATAFKCIEHKMTYNL